MEACTELPEQPIEPQHHIDELLGPSEDRYFAAGYRQVSYGLDSVLAGLSEGSEAVGSIMYPSRWSAGRGGSAAVPHLSSVDAVVLPLQLLERLASPEESVELSRLRVGAIELRAGTRPWLAVDAVPVTLSVERRGDSHHLIANVGNMRVRVDLVRASSTHGSEGLPVPAGVETVYGGLFQSVTGRSLIRALDTDLGVLLGSHALDVVDRRTPAGGIEAFQWPAPTIIDYLVTMGQLTQALVYASAGTVRSEAGPLWMRTMSIRIHEHPQVAPAQFDTTTRLIRDRVLDRGGIRIHDVLVESSATSGVTARSTLAYEEQPK